MNEREAQDPAELDGDREFAEALRDSGSVSELRLRLRAEGRESPSSRDLLRRLEAMEFVDSLVGIDIDVPERLGDYRITGVLGRGGMGTVYSAFQENLERHVALKVLSPAYSAHRSMRKRFRIEARATASLHHQHIVPIYDYGEAGGCLYFAMEKVDGISLDRHLTRARRERRFLFDCRETARRFAGVANALGHAHRRRILHRDVKPGNVLVHPDGSFALADFGLSKTLGEVSVHSAAATGPSFLGTLQYASPEQARGQTLSPASDLYALGVTMYEVLAGELPYRGDTPEALFDAVLRAPPRPIRTLRADVPADLAAVIDKLLQKEPGDRYHDGFALAADLRRVADGEPVHVRRASLPRRLWRRLRRNPLLSAVTAAAAVLALAVAAQQVRDGRQARRARYDRLVQTALRVAGDEPGALDGPSRVLAVLTGYAESDTEVASDVVADLDAAIELRPDDARAVDLRRAYLVDPLPQATEMLRAGRGLAARRLLDTEIDRRQQSLVGLTEDDPLVRYRLYLTRAIASLTAAVGEPDAAQEDLHIALLFRRGAFAARLLHVLLQAEKDRDPRMLLRELEVLRASTPGGAGSPVIAELLLCWAGAARREGAHLMPMPSAPAWRRQLYDLAFDHFGAAVLVNEVGARHPRAGLDARLERLAASAAAAHADAPALARFADLAHALIEEEVGAESPLQAWRLVFELLQRRGETRRGDADPRWVQRAADELLALEPSDGLLRALRSVLEVGAGSIRVRATLALRLDGPARAHGMVEMWASSEPHHPDAFLARLHCSLSADDAAAANDAATQALQRTVLPAETLARIVRLLEGHGPRSPAWLQLRDRFRGLEV